MDIEHFFMMKRGSVLQDDYDDGGGLVTKSCPTLAARPHEL